MRRRIWIYRIAVVVLVFALGAGVAWTAERHPEIRAAQNHLMQAKARLERADHDFAGHRVKAIEHINEALEELNLALQSDKK
jgi:hypothetical protein